MRVKCVKNRVAGFFGLDYSSSFEVGHIYTACTPAYSGILVYDGYSWVVINSIEFRQMFVPEVI